MKLVKTMKRASVLISFLVLFILLTACGKQPTVIKMGVVDTDIKIWQPTVKRLKKEGIELVITPFNSYGQPNGSLFHNEIDMNAFQTKAFLKDWNHENQGKLVAIGDTYVAPMRIYSSHIKSLKQLKRGDSIALPNDDTNKARALKLLQAAGVIKLNHAKTPKVSDIVKNRHKFRYFTVDASVVVRDMSDSTIAVVNDNFAMAEHLNPAKALYSESTNQIPNQYTNVIVVNKQHRHNQLYRKVVKAFQTHKNQKYIETISNHSDQVKW
ncbi:MetQ/NlpA family ABC transporter substrate-binding protein [Nicoliella lavandulae]|uniref:MetQ/NlpA family ABC transporter substrate-binding protein n=1 Tax=Nicoliella lavandulae TaxID=3082954 RepID=A0ABU8SJ95_9LACO